MGLRLTHKPPAFGWRSLTPCFLCWHLISINTGTPRRACIGKAHLPQEKSQKFLKNKKLKETKLSKIAGRLQNPWGRGLRSRAWPGGSKPEACRRVDSNAYFRQFVPAKGRNRADRIVSLLPSDLPGRNWRFILIEGWRTVKSVREERSASRPWCGSGRRSASFRSRKPGNWPALFWAHGPRSYLEGLPNAWMEYPALGDF